MYLFLGMLVIKLGNTQKRFLHFPSLHSYGIQKVFVTDNKKHDKVKESCLHSHSLALICFYFFIPTCESMVVFVTVRITLSLCYCIQYITYLWRALVISFCSQHEPSDLHNNDVQSSRGSIFPYQWILRHRWSFKFVETFSQHDDVDFFFFTVSCSTFRF